MGSRNLSPHIAQRWKENCREQVQKCNVKEAYDQAIVIQNCAENPFLELDNEVL